MYQNRTDNDAKVPLKQDFGYWLVQFMLETIFKKYLNIKFMFITYHHFCKSSMTIVSRI